MPDNRLHPCVIAVLTDERSYTADGVALAHGQGIRRSWLSEVEALRTAPSRGKEGELHAPRTGSHR